MSVVGVLAVVGMTVVSSAALKPASDRALSTSAQDTSYGCATCHADKRRSITLGVHSERGMTCVDCHGGNAGALVTAAAHRGRTLDAGDKVAVARLCSSCHSDPGRMRQYGLSADQLAEFRTSRHGQALYSRNFDAPTCTDCHDAHMILRPEDARSNVYPPNISGTCAVCHEDAAMMRRYGLPTGQLAKYQAGAHGKAVFLDANYAAPTCVGCHGSHAALPPATTEIATVCDRCHVLLGTEFESGPHGQATRAGTMPGCLACHSNHGTEAVPPESTAALCANCHGEESQAALVGADLQSKIVRAVNDLAQAEQAIATLGVHGRRLSDARFRYTTALTEYKQIAKVQHSLDLDLLDDLTRKVSSISRELQGTAEVSRERRWEHRLLLIPVWFLALAGTALALFKLHELKREQQP